MSEKLNSNMFPEMYKDLGINVNNLGCTIPLAVTELVEDGEADLYYHPDKARYPWTRGAPAETGAHCTLLYGLLESGQKLAPHIDELLSTVNIDTITIEEVSFFPGSIPGEDYSVIVGKVALTEQLLDAHHALQMLPHIDTFPDYHPHVTLAYIKNGSSLVGGHATSTVEKWVSTLNSTYTDYKLPVLRFDYGS
jgi:2'-5' RNA ligase